MTDRWQDATWGDLAKLEYGKGLRGYADATGSIRVFGTNGPIGWHDSPLSPGPTVVVGRKGAYRGIHYSPDPCFVIDTAFYLAPFVDLDIRWAYYELLTHDINAMDSGSAIPSTSRDAFYSLPLLLPPRDEQRAIAAILGALDDKIDLNRRTNETLEAIAHAVYKSWFVDFDPVRAKAAGADPSLPEPLADAFPAALTESEVGPIPEGWRTQPIGDAVDVVGGATPSTKNPEYWEGGTHAFATPRDLSGLDAPILLTTARMITGEGLDRISSGLLPKGTVLLSSRAPIGYIAIAGVPLAVNQGFIAMICREVLPNHYVALWASSQVEAFKQAAGGTTFPEINKKTFRPLPILIPPRATLAAFASAVEPLYASIESSLREQSALNRLREALLPKLISGELRVKDAERFVEAVA